MQRHVSLTSVASSASSAGGGSDKKKRARTLLRDYYGLAGTGEGVAKKGDPMDIGACSVRL